jgi:hypothetical protein
MNFKLHPNQPNEAAQHSRSPASRGFLGSSAQLTRCTTGLLYRVYFDEFDMAIFKHLYC